MRKNTLDKRDISLINRYKNLSNVVLYTYSKRLYVENFLKKISTKYEINFTELKMIEKETADICENILKEFENELMNIVIDVTNASVLHSALISRMCARFDIEGHYQTEIGHPVPLMQKMNYYGDITNDERQILKIISDRYCITNKFQSAIDLNSEERIEMCRSNMYRLLNALANRKLIEKAGGLLGENNGRRTKKLYGFRFNMEQKMDYDVFLRREAERREEMMKIERKKQIDRLRRKQH